MKRLLALMFCAMSLGAAAQNGVCCDPDGFNYAGPGSCTGVGEPLGTYSDGDLVACDPDCSNYDVCDPAGECYNPSDPTCTCTDPGACNYNPNAVVDDGTCLFVDECGVCGGPGAVYECGCEDIPEGYCTCDGIAYQEFCDDPNACNYPPFIDGCINPNDSLCLYLDAIGECGGDCVSDCNNNGVCDSEEVFGCTYAFAVNYNPIATDDDGSCFFDIVEPIDPDGCTYPNALNYVEWASYDDGSCVFPCVGEVNTNVFDWNGDYNVSIADFLMMLSVFGDTDVDLDGVWDSSDECIDLEACNYNANPTEPCEYLDSCGVCGGPGAIYECGCNDIPVGYCNCEGGVIDECGVCDGPGPTLAVIDDVIIYYDSIFLPLDQEWYVYAVAADTIFSYVCEPTCGEPLLSPYSMTVDAAPATAVAGATTYRFYVNSEDPTDKISSIFGNSITAWEVNAPAGVFNSPFNSSWNASGVNPAFFTSFPELADDSYATIGLEGPASTSGITGAADPSIVEDAEQPVSPFFQTDGATDLLSNTVIGSAVYVLNTWTNALPDADGRWLVMQITTTGEISGQVNYQVFPLGVGANDLWCSTPFDGEGTYFGTQVIPLLGCMQPEACNYNPCANVEPVDPDDPDSCNYPDANGNCN